MVNHSNIQALLREGIAAAKAGQTERARQALMQVVELDEKNTQAWLWLSTVVDDPADKHTYLYTVLELEPGNKHAWIGLTRLEEMAELPPAPEASSTKPATSEPSSSGKYKRLSSKQAGDTFCPFCKQPLSAVAIRCEHCQLPLMIDCPACSARVNVEQIACPECDQLMGDFRHKSVYFAQLATAYYERQHYRKAVVIWQVVELLKPNYPQLCIRLAEAYVAAGWPKTAIATLRRELTKDPGQEAASLSLGEILEKSSHWAESETVYREALAVSPDSAELHLALGWTLLQRKELKEGLNYVHKATRLDPEHGTAWLRLGQLYEATEREKQAAEAYRRAAELLPTHKLAQQKAEQLAGALAPELPVALATGWSELIRQLAGPILICIIVSLLDSGMRPWQIPWPGWLALFLGILGTFLWTSGDSLPRNPAICFVVGEQGLTSSEARASAALFGGIFWLLAIGIILYPIGQSAPEVPSWILDLSNS